MGTVQGMESVRSSSLHNLVEASIDLLTYYIQRTRTEQPPGTLETAYPGVILNKYTSMFHNSVYNVNLVNYLHYLVKASIELLTYIL